MEIIKRAWRVEGNTKILNIGLPRNDDIFKRSPEDIINLKEKLGLPLDKKVILYAPTF